MIYPVLKNLRFLPELGRGLSTGSELEYADPETIKSALNNRPQFNYYNKEAFYHI